MALSHASSSSGNKFGPTTFDILSIDIIDDGLEMVR